GVTLEAGRSDAQEFGRRGQIPVTFLRADMAQIDGEMRKESLHIGAFLVPEPDTLDGKGVPEGMRGWSRPTVSGPEVELATEPLHPASERPRCQGLPAAGEEERVRWATGRVLHTTAGIIAQLGRGGGGERPPTGVIGFGFLDEAAGRGPSALAPPARGRRH